MRFPYICVCGFNPSENHTELELCVSVPEFKKEVESYMEKGSSYMNISNG